MKQTIMISLISHTNVGKTSLARTLLRRDVGDVGDQPHLTERAEEFVLFEDDQARLVLWDTPGFGSVRPLLKRLKQENGAWSWLLREVIDKVFNRSLYCSVSAARHVGETSDAVIYLVNARERPADAGYVNAELELLNALGKPVILALNQNQRGLTDTQVNQLVDQWLDAVRDQPIVKHVLVLDSFRRVWAQETRLLQALTTVTQGAKRQALERFAELRRQTDQRELGEAASQMVELLWFACQQTVDARERNKKQVLAELSAELDEAVGRYVKRLAAIFGIDAERHEQFQRDLDQIAGRFQNLDEKQTGFWSGAITGAGSGLLADVMSGGLSFGGGFVIGALLGGLGGLSVARALNATRKDQARWQVAFLEELQAYAIQVFVLALHHGRGGGVLKVTGTDRESEHQLVFPSALMQRASCGELDHAEMGQLVDQAIGSWARGRDVQAHLS